MSFAAAHPRSALVRAVYGLLDPLPFGLFVAALIFDAVYARSGEVLWVKAAAWLIVLGLLFAVVPRAIDLVRVWLVARGDALPAHKLDVALALLAIVTALADAFVHTRDAYAAMPAGLWLSALTVILLALAHVRRALRIDVSGGPARA